MILVNRSDPTLWLSEDVLQSWNNESIHRIGSGKADLVIDSTGLVIHGKGRWTRHKYGKRKRREWRKLHIGVNTD